MELGTQQDNENTKTRNGKHIAKVLLIGWSILYLSYALLGVWIGTGEHALSGPRTSPTDYIFSGVWLSLSILQLVVAIMLNKDSKRWLWWVAVAFAVVSSSLVIGAPLLAPLFSK
jgi:hypothetical protein